MFGVFWILTWDEGWGARSPLWAMSDCQKEGLEVAQGFWRRVLHHPQPPRPVQVSGGVAGEGSEWQGPGGSGLHCP